MKTHEAPAKRWLFVSDIDNTLLGNSLALIDLTEALQASSNLIIVYNSSRPCTNLRQTLTRFPELPPPNYLIGALGTEIEEGGSGKSVPQYTQRLSQDWHRDKVVAIVEEMGFTAHAPEYQTPLKVSYDVPDAASYIKVVQALQIVGLKVKVVYSGGKNLDIIPHSAGKVAGIKHLQHTLNVQHEGVVVAGNSDNDLEMFVPPYKGIVVANADPNLKARQGDHIYHARFAYAEGVLEGLRFWQVL